ncbi:DUF2806 domain-containing protein [Flavobacterium sp. W1B]|uniref:DUF2806 domain-containing protein n=1 Tax=Flavobacterium sp. W1B TaxID=3394146 RepID=UPI0039BD759A
MENKLSLISFEGKPLEKLLEVIQSGVGTLYRPRAIRKEADAKAYEIAVISKAKAIANVESTLIDLELTERIQNRIIYQETRKQFNIDNIVEVAADQLNVENEVSDEKVESDWITRFFNIAQDISDEDMQKLWGRILAGEIKQPKSFSLRAIELLKNLSKEEAEIFTKICQLKIISSTNTFIPNLDRDSLINKFNIKYLDILLLAELGLISSDSNLGLTLHGIGKKHIQVFDYGELGILMETEESASNKTIKIYKFTKVGAELSKLIQQDINIEYLNIILQSLSSPFRKLQYGYIKFIDGEKKLTNVTEYKS